MAFNPFKRWETPPEEQPGAPTPERETPIAPEQPPADHFDGQQYEAEKIASDPLHFTLREAGADLPEFNIHYEVVTAVTPDEKNSREVVATIKTFSNYHDALKCHQGLTPAEQERVKTYRWAEVEHQGGIALRADDKLWKRLGSPDDSLHAQEGRIDSTIAAIEAGTYGDAYAAKVADGQIEPRRGRPSRKTVELETRTESQSKFEALGEGAVNEDFEKTFRIKQEELKGIEGWGNLSLGQQALVLENLKQFTVGRIQSEAISKFKEEVGALAPSGEGLAKLGEKKFYQQMWRNIAKPFYLARAERQTAEAVQYGGIKEHGEILRQLVSRTRESGVDATFGEDGSIQVAYVKVPILEETPEGKTLGPGAIEARQFNEAANRLAKVPHEWSEPTATRAHRKAYEAALAGYASATVAILERKKQELADNRGAALAVADFDRKVQLDRFLTANPDVEAALEQVHEAKFWKRAMKSMAAERGSYMALGFATRTATAHFLGLVAAPIVAAGMGAWIARKRTIESFREEKAMAGRGKRGKGAEAELMTMVDATNLDKKIDQLILKIGATTDEAEAKKLRGELDTRLNYSYLKLEKGLVNFGGDKEQLANQYNLLKRFSEAEVALQLGEQEVQAALQERLNGFLAYKDKKLEKHLTKKMLMGAGIGATFAVAGYGIRSFFSGGGAAREAAQTGGGKGYIPPDHGGPSSRDYGAPPITETTHGATPVIPESLKTGAVPPESLRIGAVTPESLKTGAVPPESLKTGAVMPESLKVDLSTGEGVKNFIEAEHPGLLSDTTWQIDNQGGISRSGYEGSYAIDQDGNITYTEGGIMEELKPGSSTWEAVPLGKYMGPDQLWEFFAGKHPAFANDSTWKFDSTGIHREGYTGTYTMDGEGNLHYEGPEVETPKVLKPGSTDWVPIEEPKGAGAAVAFEIPEELKTPESYIETAGKGSSVWSMIEHQLKSRVPNFENLKPAQRTWLIDYYKDQVVAHPETFGLKDPDLVQVGQKVNLGRLFSGVDAEAELAKATGRAQGLSEAAMKHIMEYRQPGAAAHEEVVEAAHGGDAATEAVPAEYVPNPEQVAQAIQESNDMLRGSLEKLKHFDDLSLFEQRVTLHTIEDAKYMFDHLGVDTARVSIFSEIDQLSGKAASELLETEKAFSSLLETIHSGIKLDWTAIGSKRVSSILEIAGTEAPDQLSKGALKLVDVIRELKPNAYEKTLTFTNFLMSRFTGGGDGGIKKIFDEVMRRAY